MRKKYLSALLFGALLFASTGTFTSCKDYDDDIDNLQEQIDGLATKSDMESKLTQMQTALNSAQSDAQSALSQAQQALQAAQAANNDEEVAQLQQDIEALEKRVKALEDAAIDVEALKAEVSASVESQIGEFRTEMAALIQQVEDLVGSVADMVTDVELVVNLSGADEEEGTTWNGYTAQYQIGTITEQDNVFGKGLEGEITFTKGNQVQLEDYIVIRVSPTNAVIDPTMISFQNSKGDKLDDLVEVSKVERYTGLIARAESDNGLWKVYTKLKSYDEKAFEAAMKTEDGKRTVNFAVAVNNTKSSETASARQVISSYDVIWTWGTKKGLNELTFKVNDEDIDNIRNRYDASEAGTEAKVTEYVWKGDAATAIDKDKTNVVEGDDRCDNTVGTTFANSSATHKLLPVEQGKPFTIELTGSDLSMVRAIYVTRDDENAVESAPSELNAWNSYSYEGLNTVVEGTETTVTINASSAINDIIGFRVYAVNYDGTLLDPDGKAFYVIVGDQAVDLDATNTTIIPDADQTTLPTDEESAKENVTISKFETAATLEWKTDKIGNNEDVFTAIFIDKDGKEVFTTDKTDVSGIDFSKVTQVYTQPTIDDWTQYEDGKTYSGTLTIKNANGGVLATKTVTMTKELPTALPEGFSIKTNQVVDGIYNCYMIPDDWAAEKATEGTMVMTEVFNFGKGIESQYVITFDASAEKDNKDVEIEVKGDGTLAVAKDYIDNETEHATKVEYNYGKISSQKDDKGNYVDYKVEAATFNTIYNCIYNDTYTWAWATNDNYAQLPDSDRLSELGEMKDGAYVNPMPSTTLTYGTAYSPKLPSGGGIYFDAIIYGTSDRDSRYSGFLSRSYQESLVIKEATLTSDANGEAEYFTVELENNHIKTFQPRDLSTTTNPTADVPSTLTIKAKDMYGHDVEIKLPMIVTKR